MSMPGHSDAGSSPHGGSESFTPRTFIDGDGVFQTLHPSRLPIGWVTFEGVESLDIPKTEIVFAIKVGDVFR